MNERPADPIGPGVRWAAAGTLLLYGTLLLAADVLGVREQAGMTAASFWSVAHMTAVVLLAVGILQGQKWAWWGTLLLSVVALFLLAPVVIGLVGGPGLSTLVPTVHLVLVCLEGAALVFLIAMLTRIPHKG